MAFIDTLLTQLMQLLDIGGPVVWILAAVSVYALSISLYKWGQFIWLRPETIPNLPSVIQHWNRGQVQLASNLLKPQHQPSAILLYAMQELQNNQCKDNLKDELGRQGANFIAHLRAQLRALEVIASLSPLLGLMGTVLGMIVAFQQMEAAGSQIDPAVLSGGIWQALLTTAAGLAVAIPVSALHNWFELKVERCSFALNDALAQIYTRAPAPALVTNQ